MKNKIGVLTHPLIDNYGGILQCVALCALLKSYGCNVTVIQKLPFYPVWKRFVFWMLASMPGQNIKGLRLRERKKKKHDAFIRENINFTAAARTKEELRAVVDRYDFDTVIVGSDQVWRYSYINDGFYKSYFLDFLDFKKTKALAYAASFGKEFWEGPEHDKETGSLLKPFYSISVREPSGIEICRKIFNRDDARHVLDPTLLMPKEFYLGLIGKNRKSSRAGLVTYILDETPIKQQISSAVTQKLVLSDTTHLLGFGSSADIYSIPEWLELLSCADFVVTDSYHGMLFSIIFEKPFIVTGNAERGTERLHAVLGPLNLDERLVTSAQDVEALNLHEIDYSVINSKLASLRSRSIDFLLDSIN